MLLLKVNPAASKHLSFLESKYFWFHIQMALILKFPEHTQFSD